MKVNLLTKGIIRNLPKLYAHEGQPPESVPVVVKFFTPDAQATWYITEAEQRPGAVEDWTFFGLCDVGLGFPELGYVTLSELRTVRGKYGLPVERDRHYSGTLADAMRETQYHRIAA